MQHDQQIRSTKTYPPVLQEILLKHHGPAPQKSPHGELYFLAPHEYQ